MSYQNVQIEGYATHDPETKKTKTGKTVCNFSLAYNHTSKNDSEPHVSYVDIETWETIADICSNNISKGKHIMVFGNLRQERWKGDDGKNKSRLKVVGNQVKFLESPSKTIQ